LSVSARADGYTPTPERGQGTPVSVRGAREVQPERSSGGAYYIYIEHQPGNPAGWAPVREYLVGSGCEGYTCGSAWTPRSPQGLFEKYGDRAYRGHGQGDGNPPTGLAVWDGRAKCGDGAWSAGTWYHNGYFRLTWDLPRCHWEFNRFGPGEHAYVCDYYGSWQGPTSEGWNFAEDDACFVGNPDGGNKGNNPGDGGGGNPTPTSCAVTARGYDPARMTGFGYFPQHPVVVGQGGEGFYLTARFVGGRFWEEDCEGRHYTDDPIASVDVSVSLADSSRRWIEGELAARYYGARVKDTYPKRSPLFYGSSMFVGVRWPRRGLFEALDPGYYVVKFTVRTTGGKVFVFTGRAPVYLGDSTLIR